MRPEIIRPPYFSQPSLDDAERVRRIACRVLVLGRSASVPNALMPAFREVAALVARELDALPPGERSSLRREAEAARGAAR
jgi:hypothetical protein